ncbi:MAG: sulfurtransferase TusA family protein [Candidatus Nanopelagicaceae bacterium]|jgi:tRNA 2-thiouridine synthesizing protein A
MKVVDCLGSRCPIPIIQTSKALKDLAQGESLRLLADDPATQPDLHAWARMTGNRVEILGPTEFKVTKEAPDRERPEKRLSN